MVSFEFDIYTEKDKVEIMGVEQCTNWIQCYAQPV